MYISHVLRALLLFFFFLGDWLDVNQTLLSNKGLHITKSNRSESRRVITADDILASISYHRYKVHFASLVADWMSSIFQSCSVVSSACPLVAFYLRLLFKRPEVWGISSYRLILFKTRMFSYGNVSKKNIFMLKI